MIELELLGLHPDGSHVTLVDGDGNRYSLPVTDELRAALRTDLTPEEKAEAPQKTIRPVEVQAMVRAGQSIDEICRITSLPASRVSVLARPILAEREYHAKLARAYTLSREAGSMNIEELVAARLRQQRISLDLIEWDAVRPDKGAWNLIARFPQGDAQVEAIWEVQRQSRTLTAVNEDARTLSDPRPAGEPAPALSFPALSEEAPAKREEAAPASTESHTSRLDSMLASLQARRGKPAPEVTLESEELFDDAFLGAHPATSAPHEGEDATVLSFPPRTQAAPEPSEATDATTESEADGEETQPEAPAEEPTLTVAEEKPKKTGRRSVPADFWDIILDGK